jgi:hypothetical protein
VKYFLEVTAGGSKEELDIPEEMGGLQEGAMDQIEFLVDDDSLDMIDKCFSLLEKNDVLLRRYLG